MERKDHGNIAVSYQGAYSDLLCPRCDSELLHHCAVEVYERCEEDTTTTITKSEGATFSRDVVWSTEAKGNPSERRNGIVISFFCENCTSWADHETDRIELTGAQHEGTTQLAWRFRPLAEK